MKGILLCIAFLFALQEPEVEAKPASVAEVKSSIQYYLNSYELLEMEGQFIQRVRPNVFMFKDPSGEIVVRINNSTQADMVKLGVNYTVEGYINSDIRGVSFEVKNFHESD